MNSMIRPYAIQNASSNLQRLRKSQSLQKRNPSDSASATSSITGFNAASNAASVAVSMKLTAKNVSGAKQAAEDDILKEYEKELSNAADGFADFTEKLTSGPFKGAEVKKYVGGSYLSHDVSAKDMDFSAIDRMKSIYQSYKNKIEASFEGEEKAGYLEKLDASYNAAFAEKIIKPVKEAFDDKIDYFRPDSEDGKDSLHGVFGSVDSFEAYISNYLDNQAFNKSQTAILTNGTKSFYDMAKDTSLWHDSFAVKNILKSTMDAYASVKESSQRTSVNAFAKSAADEIAKRISDEYIQNLNEHKVGVKKEAESGADAKWKEFFKNSDIKIQPSGMVNVKIQMKDLLKLLPAESDV